MALFIGLPLLCLQNHSFADRGSEPQITILKAEVRMKCLTNHDDGDTAEFFGQVHVNFIPSVHSQSPGASYFAASPLWLKTEDQEVDIRQNGGEIVLGSKYCVLSEEGVQDEPLYGYDAFLVSAVGIKEEDFGGDDVLGGGDLFVHIPASILTGATKSPGGGNNVNVRFRNSSPSMITTHWVDFNGQEKYFSTISPGQVITQQTFGGHLWRFRAMDHPNNSALDRSFERVVNEIQIPANGRFGAVGEHDNVVHINDNKMRISGDGNTVEISVNFSTLTAFPSQQSEIVKKARAWRPQGRIHVRN
jgi:hypothetical protein